MNQQVQEKNVVMISVEASMFGGYKRTTESDITSAGGRVPDTDILTKGGKHIFPSEKLSVFSNIKKNLYRELWKFGVKSFGGSVIAISEDDLLSAEKLLDSAQADFDTALADLRLNYDTYLDAFIKKQPNAAAASIIRDSALKADDACSRFSFSYDSFMPTPVGKNGSLESMAAKLTDQLYVEIAVAAQETYDKTFCPEGADGKRYIRTVGQKAKRPLLACREKLKKMSFLNPNVVGAVEIIDSVLATTQSTGYIEDTPSNPAAKRLLGLVTLMKDAEKFSASASKIAASSTPGDDIEVMCGVRNQWQPGETDVAQAVAAIARQPELAVNSTTVPAVTVPYLQPANVAEEVAPELLFF